MFQKLFIFIYVNKIKYGFQKSSSQYVYRVSIKTEQTVRLNAINDRKAYYVPTCLMGNIGLPVVRSKQDNNFLGHKSLNTKWLLSEFCHRRKEPWSIFVSDRNCDSPRIVICDHTCVHNPHPNLPKFQIGMM